MIAKYIKYIFIIQINIDIILFVFILFIFNLLFVSDLYCALYWV